MQIVYFLYALQSFSKFASLLAVNSVSRYRFRVTQSIGLRYRNVYIRRCTERVCSREPSRARFLSCASPVRDARKRVWRRREDGVGANGGARWTKRVRRRDPPDAAVLLAHRRSAAAPRVTASTIATRGAPTPATATRLRRGAFCLRLPGRRPSSRCRAPLTL